MVNILHEKKLPKKVVNIAISDAKLLQEKAGCYALMLEEGFSVEKQLKEFIQLFPDLPKLIEHNRFTGKALEIITAPIMVGKSFSHLIVVGLGKYESKKSISVELYRRALAKVIRQANGFHCNSLAIQQPSASLFNVDAKRLAHEMTVISYLTEYHFDEYITDESRKRWTVADIILCVDAKHSKDAKVGLKTGLCVGYAVNEARHWIDLPASIMTPEHMIEKAKSIAKEHDLKITVFNEEQVIKMGMGGLAGVSAGSVLDCYFLVLEYKAKKKSAQTIAFVGKGITFDSGGLSIKPAEGMETMKEDMAGSATVINTMRALAELKPDVNVIGITPITENLPSGTATKPGDILRFYNGKTAEVKNTDAEGRLVLADALSYAVKHYKLDAIIDIATLTGSCAHALGPLYTGLMSQHDDLVQRVQQAAEVSGDFVWRLPMNDDYKAAIRSEVADMANIGSRTYMAGAITAAFFLQNFVDDVPWVHLDIAGTAFDVPDRPYYRRGATGAGLRLLVELAMNW